MNLNELTRDELKIVTFGLQDHIAILDEAIVELEGMRCSSSHTWRVGAVKSARLDTKILLDRFREALDSKRNQ